MSASVIAESLSEYALPEAKDMPTRALDNWRTRLPDMEIQHNWVKASSKYNLDEVVIEKLNIAQHSLVFVNGKLCIDASDLPSFISIKDSSPVYTGSSDSNRIKHSLADLNCSSAQCCYDLTIDGQSDLPLCIYWLITEENVYLAPRLQITFNENAQLQIIEQTQSSVTTAWSNNVANFQIGSAAICDYVVLASGESGVRVMQHNNFNLQTEARVNMFSCLRAAKWLRHSIEIDLAGENSSCALSGLQLSHTAAHLQQQTFIRHLASNTTSYQGFKGLAESGVVDFMGRVNVASGCVNILANQNSDHLLLDNKSESYNKPQLVIRSEDVECTHGATVGALDEKELFYMQSRGLSLQQARSILAQAFAVAELDNVSSDIATILRSNIQDSLDIMFAGGG